MICAPVKSGREPDLQIRLGASPATWFAGLLAVLPGFVSAACSVSGTALLPVAQCGAGGVQYRTGSGSLVLNVDAMTLPSAGVDVAPQGPDDQNNTSGGPYDQTLNLTGGTSINNPTYSGVIMQTHKADRKATVTAASGVVIDSGGGFGGIWVRNDTSGDISITSAAAVTSSNDAGVTGTTNLGNVSVSNSGRVISSASRGIYADGGFNNLSTDQVLVSILNDVGGWVTGYTAGARSINYQGMSQIENRARIESATRQAAVAWSNNGPAKIINSGTLVSSDDHGIQVATEFGDATVINSGSVTASDDPGVVGGGTSGFAAIYAEVDLDTASTPGVHGDVSVTNQATGVVSAPNDYAIYAASPQGSVSVSNAGSASGLHGIWVNAVSGAVAVTNSGTLTASDAAGIGVRVVAGSSGVIENSGTITAVVNAIQTDAAASLTQIRNLSGGVLEGHLALAGSGAVLNGGTLVLPASGSSSVAGSYTQSYNGSTGLLRVRVSSATVFGKLAVTGAVNLPSGARIDVRTGDSANCNAIPAGTVLASVISSGASLSSSDITVTDDCSGMNFSAVRNGQAINLVSALPVQAACGDAINHATAFSPSTNLCLRGTASVVTSGSPWTWTCQGTSGGSDAVCTAPNASTLNIGNGTGLGRADVSSPNGNTNAWTVDAANSKGFIATTDPKAPPQLPSGVIFPLGLFDVKLITGDPGTQAQLTIRYPEPLPAGAVWWKYGKTQSVPTPHWYVYSGAVLSGNTVTLTLQDGGQGDDDLQVNSEIVDPGGVGVGAGASIPTLSEWGLAGLIALVGGMGWWGRARAARLRGAGAFSSGRSA